MKPQINSDPNFLAKVQQAIETKLSNENFTVEHPFIRSRFKPVVHVEPPKFKEPDAPYPSRR